MASKSSRDAIQGTQETDEVHDSDFLLAGKKFLDPFAVGSWTPNVDICETRDRIVVVGQDLVLLLVLSAHWRAYW